VEAFSHETLAGIGIGVFIVLQLLSQLLEKVTEGRSNNRSCNECVTADEFHELRRKLEAHIRKCAINEEIERRIQQQTRK
tara:strand:+ start:510 stop:749 length:240 start_codon:yes stop_codon:yes gene_type:complete